MGAWTRAALGSPRRHLALFVRKGETTSAHAHLPTAEAGSSQVGLAAGRGAKQARAAVRYVAGVLVLSAAYYAVGRAGLALQYSGPVTAIWPPVGVGVAALYLGGLRWWPGVLIGDLLLSDPGLPVGSRILMTVGNMADVLVIALLLRQMLGRRAALDRLGQLGGMLVAIAAGAAITSTFALVSVRAGGAIESPESWGFWRSWLLSDASGSLVIIPLVLAWAQGPGAAWRGRAGWEGALMIGAVVALSAIALSSSQSLTYMVFPALIWAALRFGQQGATLAVAVAAALAVWITARDVGPFVTQSITDRTLSTQLYIAVAALATLCLAAVVSERRRAALNLAESQRREGERAAEERQRIARDLHDAAVQSLFATTLHLRTAERALARDAVGPTGPVQKELDQVGQLTRGALREIRAAVFHLRPSEVVQEGLVAALANHAAATSAREELAIAVHGPERRLPLATEAEDQLYALVREALANSVKHADASAVAIDISATDRVVAIEVRDDGRGFMPAGVGVGCFGLQSMHSRATQLGGRLTITSAPSRGTAVRVEVPAAGL
jgi:signal transduction histidine kinase